MSSIIYGKNPIKEALEAGQPLNKIYIGRGKRTTFERKIIQLARQQGIPVREMDRRKLTELSGSEAHQGIVAILSEVSYSDLDTIFHRSKQKGEPVLIALLDEIQDPRNLGAIIRSAEAFGFHGIIIPQNRSVTLTEVVAKTSAGAVAYLPVVRVNNLARTMDNLKEKGVWIAGTDQTADKSLYETDLNMALGIVIGSEGKGMRRLVREKCDFLIKIPMTGRVNSLNASVAAAICFAEIRRQRSLAPL